MSSRGRYTRDLQQQPERRSSQQQQQQQSGSNEFQPKPGAADPAAQQQGEGSYEGSRDYKQRTEEYLKTHDVQKDAEAAKPRSDEEARELEKAEKEGRSHSKGER